MRYVQWGGIIYARDGREIDETKNERLVWDFLQEKNQTTHEGRRDRTGEDIARGNAETIRYAQYGTPEEELAQRWMEHIRYLDRIKRRK